MAIAKHINKLNHIEGIIKIVNDAAAPAAITVDLDVDLLKSNETLTGVAPIVNISSIEASIADGVEVILTRGGTVVQTLFENTNNITNAYGADNQNNTSDVVFNFTGKGTLIVRFLKIKGFQANYRPEQGVGV